MHRKQSSNSIGLPKAATIVMAVSAACCTPLAAHADRIKTVFKVVLENHNWTQPDNKFSGGRQQIYKNPNAPYINSLIDGTLPVSSQVAYAIHYHNVLATPSGSNPDIHPSEPNYIWSEAGSNLGVFNDNDPYQKPGGTHQATSQHLSMYLTKSGHSWKSYQEDIDLQRDASGNLTNSIKPRNQWTVPLRTQHGTSPGYTNQYNGNHQYYYAAKHNPQVLFNDTSGGGNPSPANPQAGRYAPLGQLQTDLKDNTVADYNVITPDQYNDMHSILDNGFTAAGGEHLTGDASRLRAADHFLSQLVPEIMRSQAYQNGGVIELWWDETEGGDSFDYTIPEIIISRDVHPNVNGKPYASPLNFSHSSSLKTMQEIFNVGPLLRHASDRGVNNLSDLFADGAIPH